MRDDGVAIITVGLRFAGSGDFPYLDIAELCNRFDNTDSMTLDALTALCRGWFQLF